MISELLKKVMVAHSLKQVDLAEVLGCSLSRVKAITSGRVKNLTREESEALIGKLDIRADWLITGEGPMTDDDEPQDEFAARMESINRTAQLVNALPLSALNRKRLAAVLTGDPTQDAALIANAIKTESLPSREAALLDNYLHTDESGKKIIEGTAALAAQSKTLKKA